MILNCENMRSFIDFKTNNYQIAILNRQTPVEAKLFFSELNITPFSISGYISQENSYQEINKLIEKKIPLKIKKKPFYKKWLKDMSSICKMFCLFQEKSKISFWLGSERGCKRFHVDMVPYRCLITYSGQGTELLPDKAADRNAFVNGKPNKNIIKNKLAIKYLNRWDVAIFRGGSNGILHRTPESALNHRSSILMRLDDSNFLEQLDRVNSFV